MLLGVRERNFRILAGVAAAAAALAVVLAADSYSANLRGTSVLRDAVILAVLAIVAGELSVEVRDRVTVDADGLPLLIGIMFLGQLPAIAVAAVVGIWGGWRESSRSAGVYNCANVMLSVGCASWVFGRFSAATHLSLSGVSLDLLVGGAAAAAAYEILNNLLTSLAARVKYGITLASFWRDTMATFLRSAAILSGLGLLIAAIYAEAGMVSILLLFPLLFASQYMFKLLVREREHLATQKELADRYLEMNIGLAVAMIVLLDSKDEYTAAHSAAVAMYCRDMAETVGLSVSEADELHLAGLLHDLGKVGTPDAVLRKDSALGEEEWEYIWQHPSKGAEVLSHLAAYQSIADIVRFHHERLDGSGYPYGLTADQIPEASKILAVADSYHAITSDRPYRPARSSFDALKELRKMADGKLDGTYVEALAMILRDKDLAYRDGTSTDFMDEYQKGRINLRLRGQALADLSGLGRGQEDPAVS